MKVLTQILLFFLTFGFGANIPVFADHYAIVICKVNDRGHLLVETADVDNTCGMSGVGQKARPCAVVLHEISSKGYELFNVISQETEVKFPIVYLLNEVDDKEKIEELMAKIEREIEIRNELIFIFQCKNDGK